MIVQASLITAPIASQLTPGRDANNNVGLRAMWWRPQGTTTEFFPGFAFLVRAGSGLSLDGAAQVNAPDTLVNLDNTYIPDVRNVAVPPNGFAVFVVTEHTNQPLLFIPPASASYAITLSPAYVSVVRPSFPSRFFTRVRTIFVRPRPPRPQPR